ncbi:rmlC-like jelly roll fold protein [Artemisia annua]|uniref:RmlC-like jelly roll fold protein n=1 Tax=Artemisia annua TaxID=35608 RepID=A0A2U1M2K3_ARTAN|nr:rmlC-like jelly roll fold protein [Artemisia annua]
MNIHFHAQTYFLSLNYLPSFGNTYGDKRCGVVPAREHRRRRFGVYAGDPLAGKITARKAFAHTKAWNILKDQKKWQEQPLVSHASESTGSSKKRKSSESSSAQTPTNETPINVEDFDLPNLNENPTPSHQPRGKKKVDSGDTSRSSMRDTLASYAAEKKSLLQWQVEVQKKKDEEYFNFINGEVMNRDMKFVMDPHDNIPDPAFKQFVIDRKREICAKYGWPCSL